MDDHALVAMEAGLAGPLVAGELLLDDEDDLDLLDLGLPTRMPMAEERLAAFAQQAAEARSPEALQGLSEQAARMRVEAEHAMPDVHATDFGAPFVPDSVNQRSRFAELRTTALRFATAAKTWQLAADQCHELLKAASRIGLPAEEIEHLKAEAADNAAQAQRQHILSHLTQAIWQLKELQLVPAPGREPSIKVMLLKLRLQQENLASMLDGALRHCHSPELAGRPVLPAPIRAFERELLYIKGGLLRLHQRRKDLHIQNALQPPEGSHPLAPMETSKVQSQAAVLAEHSWNTYFATKYDDLPRKALSLHQALQGDGPGPLPMPTDSQGAEAAVGAAEAISALATHLEQELVLEAQDEPIEQRVDIDIDVGAQPVNTPTAALQPTLPPEVLNNSLDPLVATHQKVVKGLVRKLGKQRPPQGEEARRLADRCASQQSQLLESDVLSAQSAARYTPVRLAAPLAALQQAFEALIPNEAGVLERLGRAEQLLHAARAARDIAVHGGGDQAAEMQTLADHCMRLRLDELAHAAMLDSREARQVYQRLGESSTKLLDRANDSAHDARDLLFGDPMPDEVQPEATGLFTALRGNDHAELVALGNRVAGEAMASAKQRAPLPPDTPEAPLGRQKSSKIELRLLSFACKQAASMVSVLADAERELERTAPANRSRIATQFAGRVHEAALASKELFAVLEDDNNGLEQVEIQRLRSGLLLNERTAELMRQNLLVLAKLFDARHYALELRQGLATLNEKQLNVSLEKLKEKFIQVDEAIDSAATQLIELSGADPTPVHNVRLAEAMMNNTFSEFQDRVRNEHNIVTAKIALEILHQCFANIGDGIVPPQMLQSMEYYFKSSQAQLKSINAHMLARMSDSESRLKAANVPNAEEFLAPRRRKIDILLRITIPLIQEFARCEDMFNAAAARSLSPHPSGSAGAAQDVVDGQPSANPPAKGRPGRQKGRRR